MATLSSDVDSATASSGADLSVTTQGDEAGPVDIVYTVSLSRINNTGSAISFDLDDLLTGTAASGADYTAIAPAAQISVADGAHTGTLTVPVTDDALLETTETIIARISNPSHPAVTIGTSDATANITDNDTATADLSVTTQGDEAGPVAKAMLKLGKDMPVELKGGLLDGEIYDAKAVEAFSKLPSKVELIQMLMGAMNAPAAALSPCAARAWTTVGWGRTHTFRWNAAHRR